MPSPHKGNKPRSFDRPHQEGRRRFHLFQRRQHRQPNIPTIEDKTCLEPFGHHQLYGNHFRRIQVYGNPCVLRERFIIE